MAIDRFAEKLLHPRSGWIPLLLCLAALIGGPIVFLIGIALEQVLLLSIPLMLMAGSAVLMGIISLFGFLAIPPNMARVLLLFGSYQGTVSNSGFFWVNPFYSKKKISLRVRNFETGSHATPETKDAQGRVVSINGKYTSHSELFQ